MILAAARGLPLLAWTLTLTLCVVPLAALGWAALHPEPDAFTGVVPSLQAVFTQSGTLWLLLRSVGLSLAVAALALPAGTWLAWAEHRLDFPARRGLLALTLLPLAMPSYILAASVAKGLGPSGWLPLFSRVSGLSAAVLVLAVVTVPYVQLVVGSALANGSAAEEEAARSLGAPSWRVFRDIALPRIRPALGYSGLLAMLYAISDFGAVAVLDTPVLTWRLYQAVAVHDLARAAVLGAALLGATLPLFLTARWVQGASRDRAAANPRSPARRPASALQLGLTLLVAGVVVGLGVLFPISSLVVWTVEGWQRGLVFAPLWIPVAHTLFAATLATAFTLLVALPPAVVVGARRRSGSLDGITYLTSALPGVLLAFGWILGALFVARLWPGSGLYKAILGSGALLAVGYATRFVAEAYTPLKTVIWRVDRRLWESHRALDGPPGRFLGRVALPLVRPGLQAGALLVFLAILKELPVTLLLGAPTGLSTLAFRVWDRSNEALWHDAGAAGLVLVGLAVIGVIVARQEVRA